MTFVQRVVRFGSFEVDTRTGELRRQGVRIKLQEKPFQLLVLLLQHAPDIVTRDQLREVLWPANTFVDFDHSLGTAIAKLRTALGDSARSPRFIETVASRGYRFVAPIVSIPEESAAGSAEPADDALPAPNSTGPGRVRWIAGSVAAGFIVAGLTLVVVLGFDISGAARWLRRESNQPIRSLAVLPLQNLSRQTTEDYFVDGVTEQLITALADLQGVRVISRTSAMQFKDTHKGLPEIGRELDVDAVVEGSVQRDGERVRITAQLVDARTDQHLWAQSYDRRVDDALVFEDEIARAIAGEVQATLSPRPAMDVARRRPPVPEAQEAYLRGRYHLNKGTEPDIRRSIDDFNQAIAKDADAAPAHAGLAIAYVALTDFYERPSRTMPPARRAAENALKIDGSLAEAHAALGAVRFLYDWDFAGAEEEFKRATGLNGSSGDAHAWYGTFLAQMGRFDAAQTEMTRAAALDPLSVSVHVASGWALYLARRNDQALAEWQKALDLEPGLGVAHISIWLVYAQGAHGGLTPPVQQEPGDTSPLTLATVAGIHAMAGRRAEAERVLAQLTSLADHRYVCPYEVATAHAALGHRDDAIKWLQRGVDDRSVCMPDLKVDPRFDSLHDDPRFAALLRAVGFPP